MRAVIVTNPNLRNQTVYADHLKAGFERHGLEAEITSKVHRQGDVTVVQGPHYALKEHTGGKNVLFLNRCFYFDDFDNVSIGWLNSDGSRFFLNDWKTEPNGDLPELKPLKTRNYAAIVFGDYNRDASEEVRIVRKQWSAGYFKAHPASSDCTLPRGIMPVDWDLRTCWKMADAAVGHQTTALVDARINGLEVISTDRNHVVQGSGDRESWLIRLSWAQWHHSHIRDGAFFEHLKDGML